MTELGRLLGAFALGWVVTAAIWNGGRRIFDGAAFRRSNYREHPLPTAVGLVLPLTLAVVVGVHAVAFGPYPGGWDALSGPGAAVLALVVAFSFLGLLDDLGGVGESGGFRGHLRALRQGRLTTGMLKLVAGPFVSLAVLSAGGIETARVGIVRDAALVCLAANLANLFDRAPGRVNKVAQVSFVAVALATRDERLASVAVVVGGAGALLRGDLHEAFMLGDAGSNVLGAALGIGVVLTTTGVQRWIGLGALLVLNAASEAVSFSRVIDRVGLLRRLDRLGSPHRVA